MIKHRLFFFILTSFLSLAIVPSFEAGIYAAPGAPPPGIVNQIKQTGQADIILVLDDSDARALAKQMRDNLGINNDNAAIITEKVHLYRQKKDKVLSRLAPADYTLNRDYDYFPIMHLMVNGHALEGLLKMIEVTSISENAAVQPYLAESLPLIGATPTEAWAYSTGAGTFVAVLDTGVNYTLSAFGSCTAPGSPSTCKIAYEQCFATGGCQTNNDHGTNVSGIVVGVAPDTKVLSLDVFRTDGIAYYNDIISALNWVMANNTTYNIVSVNMSLGNGQYTSTCPSDGLASAITTMKGAGITTAVASGNNGYTNAIAAPACSPDAVSVGAVYDSNVGGITYAGVPCTDSTTSADQVTCFSNSASFLTMLAPGALITAAGLTFAGTSQATPFISGSVAVLKSLDNTLTVDKVVGKMTTTGVADTDSRNSITKPRINLYGAVGATAPIIGVNPSSVSFMAGQNGPNPANQLLNIVNNGGGTLNWSISNNPGWLTPTPLTATAPSSDTLSVNTAGLAAGSYNASLLITASGALNSPLTVPVSLQVVDPAYTEDFETGNLTKFPWATGGNGLWTVQGSTAHTGSYAAQSPVLTTSQSSYLKVTLNVLSPGYVYFWLKTNTGSSSWENNLKFWLDGTNQGPFAGWYGTTDWTFAQSNIQVPAGIHTLKWGYSKTLSATGDAVWLDDIFFPPSNLQIPALSFSPASWDFGSVLSGGTSPSQSFTITNTGTGNLVIGTISISGTNPSDFTKLTDTCSSQTLAPSGSCAVGVEFTPHSSGTKSASLTVPANYPALSNAALSGTALTSYTLTVSKGGTGSGSVTSSPAGINCGTTCSGLYGQGAAVGLTAVADANSTFTGWSGGGCSGTGTCNVTMNSNTTVAASFSMTPPTAGFSGTPLSGQGPLSVTFTDSSANNPTSWSWTFGDGGTSTLQNPVHIYQTAGSFTVSLTASNAGGQSTATQTGYVAITCPALPVKVLGATPTYFSTLQSGYNATANGGTVQIQAVTLTETDVLSNGTSVTLIGGYNPCYTTNSGTYSTIVGPMTISSGPVTIQHIIIQKP